MTEKKGLHLVKNNTNSSDYNRKIIAHRLSMVLKIGATAAASIALVVLLYYQFRNQGYSNVVVSSATERLSLESNAYINHDGNIVIYSKDGISAIDEDGKALWNMTYEMQRPVVHTNSGIVAACDYDGHIIYVITGEKKISQIDTNLPVRDFAVSKEGRVAAILEGSGVSWVNLYDSDGSQLVELKASMSKTGYPLAVALSGEVMGVSYFFVDGNTMKSSVTFYNFGGIGENVSDHIVSSYDYTDAVVPSLSFLNNECIAAVADNRIVFYQGSKKPVNFSDILIDDRIIGVYPADSRIALLFFDNTGENKYRMSMYNTDGKCIYTYGFDMDYKDVVIGNGQAAIYNEQECIIVGDNGKTKFQGQLPTKVITLCNTGNNRKYIAVTKESIETLSFD